MNTRISTVSAAHSLWVAQESAVEQPLDDLGRLLPDSEFGDRFRWVT